MAIGLSYETGQLEIGSYRGAPIYLSPLFFLLAAMLAIPFWRMVSLAGVALAFIFMAVAFASILLHELAHARMAHHYGVATERIDINISGGLVHLRGLPHTMKQDFAITLAGPLSNLAIGLFALALAALVPPPADMIVVGDRTVPNPFQEAGIAYHALRATAYLNLGLFAVNLLPGVPLDGGKLVYLLVEQRWNARIALLTVSSLGLVFACISTLVMFVSLLAGFGFWAPPELQVNWYAFEAARQGRGDWDAHAFPET
jgi:Zn-dependent protease